MTVNREPQGTPKGGQFAAGARDEADITLALPGQEVSDESRDQRVERAKAARDAYYRANGTSDHASWNEMSAVERMSALHYWAPVNATEQADHGVESARLLAQEMIGSDTPHGPVNAVLLRKASDASPVELYGVSAGGKVISYGANVPTPMNAIASEVNIAPDNPPAWARKTARPDIWALTPALLKEA